MSGPPRSAGATTLSSRSEVHGLVAIRTLAAPSRFEGRHRWLDGNALRAAVLGANDGLVSNFSLVMGVAGASNADGAVVIAGIAGLLAGSLSMALGEWLSVQSSRELYTNQLTVLADQLAEYPLEAEDALRTIYESRGMDRADAQRLAQRVVTGRPALALDTMAREKLGIDPHGLGGSAWIAAVSSFALFALGAVIPLLPFVLTSGEWAIPISALLSAFALMGLGAAITMWTGRHPIWAGLRQLAFGLGAALVTYGIGWMIGTTVL